MVETRKCARVNRSPTYEARKGREQRDRNDATRRNAVGGVVFQKPGGRGAKVKKGKGENASEEAEGKDSSSSLSKDAQIDSNLYKSTNSSIMESESGNGKYPSSSPSQGAKEDSDLCKMNGNTPMESKYSFSTPRIDANDDTTLFSKTSSKSSPLEEHYKPDYATYSPDYSNTWKGEVRTVTQTQTGAFESSTESELRAVLAQVAKDITLRRQNTAEAVSMGAPASITYEKTVAPRNILSMQKSNILAERQPPYARKFVTEKGKRLEAAPTLPGKHYFSDAIEDPVTIQIFNKPCL
jgi:hypothetical protein